MLLDLNMIIPVIFGLIGSLLTYWLGRRERKTKIASEDMNTVDAAQKMIAPLLQSADELSLKITELRKENQIMLSKISELETSISIFRENAEKCTCGAFTKNIFK